MKGRIDDDITLSDPNPIVSKAISKQTDFVHIVYILKCNLIVFKYRTEYFKEINDGHRGNVFNLSRFNKMGDDYIASWMVI
jgi:hypothetical protein